MTGELVFSIDNAKAIQSLDSVSTRSGSRSYNSNALRDLLQQHELVEVHRDLLLPESVVLQTHVTMPLAAEANLRQALAYEMDRHTPFSAEEVFFGWHNLSRDREAGQFQFRVVRYTP